MNLYKLIFEADLGEIPEKEDEDVKVGKKSRLSRGSVDDQIDSLLIKFESESALKESDLDNLAEAFLTKKIEVLLQEQETLDPAADAEGATTGSEEQTEEDEAEPNKSKIDIDQFGSKVARLIMNFDKLLKVEAAIYNRAKAFLKENYNEEHTERFDAILESQYDIEIEDDFADEEGRATPQGLGAYAGGTGTGGG
tara:strand:- start:2631 stop:3218 length:588 start_codon:yes stop_codon:yes gene_type:complete